MARTVAPSVNQTSKGAIYGNELLLANNTGLMQVAGVPTSGALGDGAGWAGPGMLCVDRTNGKLYINTNTKASPTWTVVGAQS